MALLWGFRIYSLLLLFFTLSHSPTFIVIVYIAVLAHSPCIQYLMRTLPWLLFTTEFVIAIATHSFSVVLFVVVTTLYYLFSTIMNLLLLGYCIFWLLTLFLFLIAWIFVILGRIFLKILQFFVQKLDVNIHILVDYLLLIWHSFHLLPYLSSSLKRATLRARVHFWSLVLMFWAWRWSQTLQVKV